MAANMILPAEPFVFYTVSPPPAAPPTAPTMCLPPPQALFPLVGISLSFHNCCSFCSGLPRCFWWCVWYCHIGWLSPICGYCLLILSLLFSCYVIKSYLSQSAVWYCFSEQAFVSVTSSDHLLTRQKSHINSWCDVVNN